LITSQGCTYRPDSIEHGRGCTHDTTKTLNCRSHVQATISSSNGSDGANFCVWNQMQHGRDYFRPELCAHRNKTTTYQIYMTYLKGVHERPAEIILLTGGDYVLILH